MRHLLVFIVLLLAMGARGQERISAGAVQDYADLFDPRDELRYDSLVSKFWDTARIMVVTISSEKDTSIDACDIAEHLVRKWGLFKYILIVEDDYRKTICIRMDMIISRWLPGDVASSLVAACAPIFNVIGPYAGTYMLTLYYMEHIRVSMRQSK